MDNMTHTDPATTTRAPGDACRHGYPATPVYGYLELIIGHDVLDESHADVYGGFFCPVREARA